MKKILLSISLILTFGSYAFWQSTSASNDASPAVATTVDNPSITVSNSSTGNATPPASNVPVVTPTPVTAPVPTPTPTPTGQYKEGSYTGSVADAYYGNIQVKAIISGGKLTDVQFLQYPNDRGTSIQINRQAMPILKSEAIQAQSANVHIVSGASDSSQAFQESLGGALAVAKN